jgi:hypothetical protein
LIGEVLVLIEDAEADDTTVGAAPL